MSLGRPMVGPEIAVLTDERQREIEAKIADPHRITTGQGTGVAALVRAIPRQIRRLLRRNRG